MTIHKFIKKKRLYLDQMVAKWRKCLISMNMYLVVLFLSHCSMHKFFLQKAEAERKAQAARIAQEALKEIFEISLLCLLPSHLKRKCKN